MTLFVKRTLSGMLFGILVIGTVLLGPITFFLLVLTIQVIGVFEFFNLAEKSGKPYFHFWGLLIGITTLAGLFLHLNEWLPLKWLFLPIPLIFVAFISSLFIPQKAILNNLGILILSWFFITVPLASFALIGYKTGDYHFKLVLFPVILIWVNDIVAYLTGSNLGKIPLMESVSPQKTWEGALAGIIFSGIAGGLIAVLITAISPLHGVVIGLIISTAGIFGDLFESFIKREKGVKDSGHILPGHGGILDRFDAFLFAMPFVCCYIYLFS